MIMEKVLAAAKPQLAGKAVKDLVVGISLVGCELDSGEVGVSYVLREDLPAGCSAFPYTQEAIGSPAEEIAGWIVAGKSTLQRSIASAVLAAAACGQELPADDDADKLFGMDLKQEDTVGMIGLIRPVAKAISPKVKKIIAFDKGMSLHSKDPLLQPMKKQPELLPACDVVLLSGTTTINGTIDSLLAHCSGAREIIMVGPSTPMYPAGWQGSGLTVLAGSCWQRDRKKEIFRLISQAAGIRQLTGFMQKKAVRV